MITVPMSFVANVLRREGEVGRGWLDSLPIQVASCCADWGLTLDGAPMHGGLSPLWLLYEQEAVALSELTPLLPRVIHHCMRYGGEWNDSSPLFCLASVTEALIEAGEPELRPWAKQAFELVADLAADYKGEEQKRLRKLIREVRQRTEL